MNILGREADLAPATDADDSSGYNDDDEDSLGNALSDYNSIFYDAPSIDFNELNKLKLDGDSRGQTLYDDEENRTDEDLESESLMMMSSDDDLTSRNSSTNQNAKCNANNNGNFIEVISEIDTIDDIMEDATNIEHDVTHTADIKEENSAENESNDDDHGIDMDKEFENYLIEDNDCEENDKMHQDVSLEDVRYWLTME